MVDMDTAYFGGAFDPVHSGHMGVIRALCDSKLVKKIIVSPSGVHPNGKRMLDITHRAIMLVLAVDDLKRTLKFDDRRIVNSVRDPLPEIIVCCKEALNHNFSCTFEYLNHIGFPRLVMSLDCANRITSWKYYTEIMENQACIVVSRAGEYDFDTWYKQAPHSFIDAKIEGVSSSVIRNYLQLKKQRLVSTSIFVPSVVNQYIYDQGLYQ